MRDRLARAACCGLEAPITISDLGEFGLIAAIAGRLPAGSGVVLGPGDDAAVLRAPDGRVVATTDMVIEGRHFRREWSGPVDVGRKAAARNQADVAAMGARPTAILVAFAGPADLPVDWVLALVDGIAQECATAGAAVAGGDTSGADVVTVAITALGDLAGRPPVTRSGARPGDVVAVTGVLGAAAAGLALLEAGLELTGTGLTGPEEDGLAELVTAHRRPAPPYREGPRAAEYGATSMIDVSDGLVADLGHVAAASSVGMELSSGRVAAHPMVPVRSLEAAASLLAASRPAGPSAGQRAAPGRAWLSWLLAGGDDHALAATFPAAAGAPAGWTAVGTVARGRGVTVDGREWDEAAGWEHFRS